LGIGLVEVISEVFAIRFVIPLDGTHYLSVASQLRTLTRLLEWEDNMHRQVTEYVSSSAHSLSARFLFVLHSTSQQDASFTWLLSCAEER